MCALSPRGPHVEGSAPGGVSQEVEPWGGGSLGHWSTLLKGSMRTQSSVPTWLSGLQFHRPPFTCHPHGHPPPMCHPRQRPRARGLLVLDRNLLQHKLNTFPLYVNCLRYFVTVTENWLIHSLFFLPVCTLHFVLINLSRQGHA